MHVSCSGLSYSFIAYTFELISGIRDDSAKKLHDFFPIRISIHFQHSGQIKYFFKVFENRLHNSMLPAPRGNPVYLTAFDV